MAPQETNIGSPKDFPGGIHLQVHEQCLKGLGESGDLLSSQNWEPHRPATFFRELSPPTSVGQDYLDAANKTQARIVVVYGCFWEQVPLGFCLLEVRRVKTSLEIPDCPILGPSRAPDQFLPVSSFWVTSMKCLSPAPGGPFTGWSANYGVAQLQPGDQCRSFTLEREALPWLPVNLLFPRTPNGSCFPKA